VRKYEGRSRNITLVVVAVISLGAVFSLGGLLGAARTARLAGMASSFALERSVTGFAFRDEKRENRAVFRAFSLRGQARIEGFVFFLISGSGNDVETVIVLADRNEKPVAARIAEGRRAGQAADPVEIRKIQSIADMASRELSRAFGEGGL
jgi:hypothetical protein